MTWSHGVWWHITGGWMGQYVHTFICLSILSLCPVPLYDYEVKNLWTYELSVWILWTEIHKVSSSPDSTLYEILRYTGYCVQYRVIVAKYNAIRWGLQRIQKARHKCSSLKFRIILKNNWRLKEGCWTLKLSECIGAEKWFSENSFGCRLVRALSRHVSPSLWSHTSNVCQGIQSQGLTRCWCGYWC